MSREGEFYLLTQHNPARTLPRITSKGATSLLLRSDLHIRLSGYLSQVPIYIATINKEAPLSLKRTSHEE